MNCRLKRESFNFDEELKQKINSKKNSVDFDESIIFSSRHNLGGCRDRGQTSASTASITTATSSNEGNIGIAIFENCKLNLFSRFLDIKKGRNFDDYPGLQPKITPPKHFSRECMQVRFFWKVILKS